MIVYFKALKKKSMYICLSTKFFSIYLNGCVFCLLSVSSQTSRPAPKPQRKQRPVCNCVFAYLRPTIRLH